MKLLVNLARADPIRVQDSDMLVALAVRTDFEGPGDPAGEERF
jgi:hypothetical protein